MFVHVTNWMALVASHLEEEGEERLHRQVVPMDTNIRLTAGVFVWLRKVVAAHQMGRQTPRRRQGRHPRHHQREAHLVVAINQHCIVHTHWAVSKVAPIQFVQRRQRHATKWHKS